MDTYGVRTSVRDYRRLAEKHRRMGNEAERKKEYVLMKR